jgi:hypothetical protein
MLVAEKPKSISVQSMETTETILILKTEQGKIKIEPISEDIIRVVYTLEEDFSVISGLGVLGNTEKCTWNHVESDENITVKQVKYPLLSINKRVLFLILIAMENY